MGGIKLCQQQNIGQDLIPPDNYPETRGGGLKLF